MNESMGWRGEGGGGGRRRSISKDTYSEKKARRGEGVRMRTKYT